MDTQGLDEHAERSSEGCQRMTGSGRFGEGERRWRNEGGGLELMKGVQARRG